MKISETKNKNIDEGPLDLLTKSGREQRRSFKSGEATLKATANKLMQDFAKYLGSIGMKSYNQAKTQDVIDFLDNLNVETGDINPDTPMDKNRIKQIFVDKAKARIKGGDAKGQTPVFKRSQTDKGPEFKTRRQKPPQFKSRRTQPSASAPSFKSSRAKPAATTPSFKSSRGAKAAAKPSKIKMPATVVQGIQSMSDQDKLRLGQALVKKYGG